MNTTNMIMPSLEQYLTLGLSIFEVVRRYANDLRTWGHLTANRVDLYHSIFLEKYLGIITNDKFVEDIQKELQGKFMDEIGSSGDFSFAIRGRIKSLIRLEAKFNDYVQTFIINYNKKFGHNPYPAQIVKHLERFRDVVAYRFIMQSKNHDKESETQKLISIANSIPGYFDSNSMSPSARGGYTLVKAPELLQTNSSNPSMLSNEVQPYYKDYVANPKEFGFKALVIVMKHNISGHQFELQMETFEMLKHNEHSEESHHGNYENVQSSRRMDAKMPDGRSNKLFEQAHERIVRLEKLDYTKIDVDMFHAFSRRDVEDLCGLLYGRQANPREFL